MSWFLLWKGKGANPVLCKDGSHIGYERGGAVILENTLRKVEIFRQADAGDPQWWSDDEFAFRKNGGSHFYVYTLGLDEVKKMHPAPGAVFMCNNRHWCTWEKKTGRLWVDGKVVKEGALRPYHIDEYGDVSFGHTPPITDTRPDEMAAANKINWVTTRSGVLVMALELPEKKLKVFVEEIKL